MKTSIRNAVEMALRAIIRELDADLAVIADRTMDGIVAESLAPRQFQMTLVLLARRGRDLSGRTGHLRAGRTGCRPACGRIGIRMALGADARRIVGWCSDRVCSQP